jgi:hypothetical protein
MMFQIRFNLLGCCFSCNCSAAVLNLSCRSSSGIHFRAVGLVGMFLLQDVKKRLSAGFSLITAAGSHKQQKGHLPGTHGRVFVGQVSCVRRESAAVNGQEQNGLI